MNMRAIFGVGLMAAAITLCGSDLVKNGNFSELNSKNLPVSWDIRQTNGATASVSNGELKFAVNTPGAVAFAIQKNLPFAAGKKYVITCDVKGNADSSYMIYLEGRRKSGSLTSYNVKTVAAPQDFQTVRFVYPMPNDVSAPYIVLRCIKGEVSFRKLAVKELVSLAPANSLIKNGFFEEGADSRIADWNVRGKGAKISAAADGTKLELDKSLVIQHNLPLVSGKKYTLKLQVRSSDPANQMMVYLEWKLDGNLRSHIAPMRNAPAEWTDVQLNLTFPANASNAYIVLRSIQKNVEFRNVVLTESK